MIAEVRLFELLKSKIGQQEAEAFITIMDTKIDEAKKTMREDMNGFAKQEDMYGIKKEMLGIKEDTYAIKGELTRLEGLIVSTNAKTKSELIMWMVSTAIGLLAAMTTIMKFLIDNALHH